jgi:hypothetical protein
MTVYIKTHEADKGTVIAMCDESLIDRVLSEGDIYIDIKSYKEFYNGELADQARAKKIITGKASIYSANLVGKEAIKIGLDTGIIQSENVMKVSKVPYAHAYRVDY